MSSEYKISCGQVAGRSHVPANIPCQDSVITKTENGVTLAVLSDGCGSATLSHEGSKITVESVSNFLVEKFDSIYELDERKIASNLLKIIVGTQLRYIKENKEAIIERIIEFEKNKVSNSDKPFDEEKIRQKDESQLVSYFYGTLCFIAIKDDRALIGQIGDGRVALVIDNKLEIALQEVKNDAVNGTTYPATVISRFLRTNDEKEFDELRIIKYQGQNIQAGFVVSDGCDSLIEYVDKDIGLFFRIRFNKFAVNTLYGVYRSQTQEEADEFIAGRLDKLRNVTDDDCSIGVIVKELPEESELECAIFEKPHPVIEEKEDFESSPVEEIAGENEEEIPAPEPFASDIYGDLFDDVVGENKDIYDVLDDLGEVAKEDDSVTIEQLVNAYHLILLSVKENGNYYYKKDDMPKMVFEIIKEKDKVLSWVPAGIFIKVTNK